MDLVDCLVFCVKILLRVLLGWLFCCGVCGYFALLLRLFGGLWCSFWLSLSFGGFVGVALMLCCRVAVIVV